MPYSQPAPFRLIPRFNPITVTVDLIDAIGQGIRDATAGPGAAPQPLTAAHDVPRADSTPAPIRLAATKPARQRSVPAALPSSSPASASSTASPGTVEKAEQRPGRKTAGRRTGQSIRSAAA